MPALDHPRTTEPASAETPSAARATRFDPPHEIPRADATPSSRAHRGCATAIVRLKQHATDRERAPHDATTIGLGAMLALCVAVEWTWRALAPRELEERPVDQPSPDGDLA